MKANADSVSAELNKTYWKPFFAAPEQTGHKVLILSLVIVLLPLFWFWNPNNKNNVQTKLIENQCNRSTDQLSQCQPPLATKRQMSDR